MGKEEKIKLTKNRAQGQKAKNKVRENRRDELINANSHIIKKIEN